MDELIKVLLQKVKHLMINGQVELISLVASLKNVSSVLTYFSLLKVRNSCQLEHGNLNLLLNGVFDVILSSEMCRRPFCIILAGVNTFQTSTILLLCKIVRF